MLSKQWIQDMQYLDQNQLHKMTMALTWMKADPEKIKFLEDAEQTRMVTQNFIEHQYGHQWDAAHIHKNHSQVTDETPTGFTPSS